MQFAVESSFAISSNLAIQKGSQWSDFQTKVDNLEKKKFAETIFSLAKAVICILKNKFRGAHVLLGSKCPHILTQHLST